MSERYDGYRSKLTDEVQWLRERARSEGERNPRYLEGKADGLELALTWFERCDQKDAVDG